VRALAVLGVVGLAISSAYNNYQHVQQLGLGLIGAVLSAELLKPALPLLISYSARTGQVAACCAGAIVWAAVVCFSCINTLGNTLHRHAIEQERLTAVAGSKVRAEHTILKDVAALPQCTQRKQTDRVACEQRNSAAKQALEAEIIVARSRKGTLDEHAVAGTHVRDGLLQVAGIAGVFIPQQQVFVWVTLLWTALVELGSALGALAIPRAKQRHIELDV
jgi:hypothetical protein